jgi:hypothetical protein
MASEFKNYDVEGREFLTGCSAGTVRIDMYQGIP